MAKNPPLLLRAADVSHSDIETHLQYIFIPKVNQH